MDQEIAHRAAGFDRTVQEIHADQDEFHADQDGSRKSADPRRHS
ncbi:hypothetical protein ACFSBZ_01000 [Amnibacterium flavum]|nr:hypothetical protein [Amnibacterium flavum]